MSTGRGYSPQREIHSMSVATRIDMVTPLTTVDIKSAERLMVKQAQRIAYPTERSLLLRGEPIPNNNRLFPLTVKIEKDEIMRLSGRISGATWIAYDTRFPPVLPPESLLSRLIVRHHHERFYHQNRGVVTAAIRSWFWITNVGQKLRGVIAKCQVCKNSAARLSQPRMGQLPLERVTPYVRPFTYIGVDLAGPYIISVGRRREKRWIVLFTCLTVRAIHLETVGEISTTAFMLALAILQIDEECLIKSVPTKVPTSSAPPGSSPTLTCRLSGYLTRLRTLPREDAGND